jgi:ankyrin repeat protein
VFSRGVDLSFEDGYNALHAAIEHSLSYKHEIVESLLQHGAPINAHGVND